MLVRAGRSDRTIILRTSIAHKLPEITAVRLGFGSSRKALTRHTVLKSRLVRVCERYQFAPAVNVDRPIETKGRIMPILPAEPEIFPPDLPNGGSFSFGNGQSWWCLHTKPRQEKATARYLRQNELSHYLPQVVHSGRTPKGRPYRSILPLFSGYVFLLGDDCERSDAFLGNTLVNVLPIPDQGEFATQIGQIYRLLASGLPVNAEERLPIGARCRILEGPLKGLIGTVIRRGGRDEFVAAVRFLGRGVAISLTDWQVERVEDEP